MTGATFIYIFLELIYDCQFTVVLILYPINCPGGGFQSAWVFSFTEFSDWLTDVPNGYPKVVCVGPEFSSFW